MANVACWYQTQLPTKIIDILIDDIENLKPEGFLIKSKVIGADNQSEGNLKENIRKSKHAWIPSAHWIGGFIWHYVDNKPILRLESEVPSSTKLSERISKDLKRMGFKFVGSTIIYAFMQAAGLVNDHSINCFRYEEIQKLHSG